MVENICVTVRDYTTNELQRMLDLYGEEGFALVSALMARNRHQDSAMYLFFVRHTGTNLQPPKGE